MSSVAPQSDDVYADYVIPTSSPVQVSVAPSRAARSMSSIEMVVIAIAVATAIVLALFLMAKIGTN